MTLWFDEDGKLRLGWRIVLAILLSIAANVIAIQIAGAAARSDRAADAVYRPAVMLLLIGIYSALLLFADRIEHNPLGAMGLRRHHAIRHSLAGMALGTAMISMAVLAIALFGRLSFTLRFNGHVAGLLLVEILILLTGAMAEELMFRGYPFQRLLEGVGAMGAVLVMSALFGLAHVGNPHSSFWAVTNTIAIGVLLSWAYLRTRTLWLPWGIHFGWNAALGIGYGLPVSGLREFSVLVQGKATGPTWLTGGAYGIEGSALGTLVIILGFIPLYLCTRRSILRPPSSPDQ